MRFLVDECLSPSIVPLFHEAGYEAHHVAHRGMSGWKDYQIREFLISDEFIFVTNDARDWHGLLGQVDVHPGLIVLLDQGNKIEQLKCISSFLAHEVPDLLNRVVEINSDGDCAFYDLPQPR